MLAEPDLHGVEPGSPEHLYSLGQVAAQAAVLRSPPCQHPNIVALVGEVPDAEFARLFFGIWLSPQTSEPGLRAELIAAPRTAGQP